MKGFVINVGLNKIKCSWMNLQMARLFVGNKFFVNKGKKANFKNYENHQNNLFAKGKTEANINKTIW
jgi:hypothetical protein